MEMFCTVFLIIGLPDIKESQNIALLHNQITACDSILEVRKDLRPAAVFEKTAPGHSMQALV